MRINTMSLDEIQEEEKAKSRREIQFELHNVDHERNLNLNTTLDVMPRSILIPPEKPDLKKRMP